MDYAKYYNNFWLSNENIVCFRAQKRINTIIGMISNDVRSILDVGCGIGMITNLLDPKKFRVVGLDLSVQALFHVNVPKVCATSCRLPFKDSSFDLVLSTELLEHLPDKVFENTKREFARIAQKYILVSIPFNEELHSKLVKCEECGNLFHPYGHLRSFSHDDIAKLFPNFSLHRIEFCGKHSSNILSLWGHRLRRLYRDRQSGANNIICPQCGSCRVSQSKRSIRSFWHNKLNILMNLLGLDKFNSNKHWASALFYRSTLKGGT